MRILEKIIHPCLWVFATFGFNKAQSLAESESAENLQKNLETIKKFNIFYSTKRLLAVSACPGIIRFEHYIMSSLEPLNFNPLSSKD